MNLLKTYIEKLRTIEDTHKVIDILRTSELNIPEKNLVYLYLFPRPLLDMELPKRIYESRISSGNNGVGYLEPNLVEISLIIEAYRTQQYKRFIKHLLHSFTNPERIHQILGNGQCECGLCKKRLFELGSWNAECSKFQNSYLPEKDRKEYLSYGGEGSNVSLCLDCIIQLQGANELLEEIEPGYLSTPWISDKANVNFSIS